ncbi:MAG TPA: hypothetical protein VJM48_05875, partial [Methylibium sp.]|nr:hypothetical protein [Methylibium sp.]
LRPQVMRSAEQTQAFSLDRYDLIRAQQKDTQPEPRLLLPINDSPVLPPLRAPEGGASAPAAEPQPVRP